jgi:tetratricopeptide (TPR) repeat protein
MGSSAAVPDRARHLKGLFPPDPIQGAQAIFADALRLHLAGQLDDAVTRYNAALWLNPDHADSRNNLGAALAALGRIDEAILQYQRALALRPDDADANGNLGVALAAQGRFEDAVTHYGRALLLNPTHAGVYYNLGIALAALGRIDEAIRYYQRAVELKPEYADAHNNLGNTLAALGRSDDAMTHYAQALAINPDHAEAHNNLGNIFREQGRFSDAAAHYTRVIAIQPDRAEAHFHRAEIKTFHQGDEDLTALEKLAHRETLPPRKGPFIHFALAKALEDSGDYPGAFRHLRTGNLLKRAQINYDETAVADNFRRIEAMFDQSLFERFPAAGDPSSTPVFVLGMPRSGSSLIEQILASHPQIHGAGELTDLETAMRNILGAPYPQCVADLDATALRDIGRDYLARLSARAPGKARIVDKLPGNFFYIGLIRLILPNARIIHTLREPNDTCVSCYSKLFASGHFFSYDLSELGRFYRRYSELMNHWRRVLPPQSILDVAYEDVVDDLEGQARRLVDFCGLPWDDACLNFYKTSRPVKTASAVQVRKPLFRSSLQRWRRFEAGIGPLLRELTGVVPVNLPVCS